MSAAEGVDRDAWLRKREADCGCCYIIDEVDLAELIRAATEHSDSATERSATQIEEQQ